MARPGLFPQHNSTSVSSTTSTTTSSVSTTTTLQISALPPSPSSSPTSDTVPLTLSHKVTDCILCQASTKG